MKRSEKTDRLQKVDRCRLCHLDGQAGCRQVSSGEFLENPIREIWRIDRRRRKVDPHGYVDPDGSPADLRLECLAENPVGEPSDQPRFFRQGNEPGRRHIAVDRDSPSAGGPPPTPDVPSRSRSAVGRRGSVRRGRWQGADLPRARGLLRSSRRSRRPRATRLDLGPRRGLHSATHVGRAQGHRFRPKGLWPSRREPEERPRCHRRGTSLRSLLQPAFGRAPLPGPLRRRACAAGSP